MESVAVFGGAKPCISSSSTYTTSTTALSFTSCNNLSLRTTQLSAFHSKSHLFSFNNSPSHPHATKTRNSRKPRIFLPHLVASMVFFYFFMQIICCRIVLASVFLAEVRERTIIVSLFWIILEISESPGQCLIFLVVIHVLLRNPIWSIWYFLCPGTSWWNLHYGQARWCSTWPCKRFFYLNSNYC